MPFPSFQAVKRSFRVPRKILSKNLTGRCPKEEALADIFLSLERPAEFLVSVSEYADWRNRKIAIKTRRATFSS